MEKDVNLGSAGALSLSFVGGKAVLAVNAELPIAGAQANVNLSIDSSVLINELFAAIEKASPAGAQPIEESVKGVILAAVSVIK